MTGPSASEVDAAIRAVLAGLSRPRADDLFAGRLFALRHAEGLAEGTTRISISPGTVITPLARDELKRRRVEIRWATEAETAKSGGEWGLVIEARSGLSEALRRGLAEGGKPWFEVGRNTVEAARWVASSPDRGAVAITEEASLATWLAHQVPGARAATVGEAEAVVRAAKAIGANLLVIEPDGKSIHQLRHLLSTFRRLGPPSPPGTNAEAPGHEDRRSDRAGHTRPEPSEPAERALRDRLALAALGAGRGLFREG